MTMCELFSIFEVKAQNAGFGIMYDGCATGKFFNVIFNHIEFRFYIEIETKSLSMDISKATDMSFELDSAITLVNKMNEFADKVIR